MNLRQEYRAVYTFIQELDAILCDETDIELNEFNRPQYEKLLQENLARLRNVEKEMGID